MQPQSGAVMRTATHPGMARPDRVGFVVVATTPPERIVVRAGDDLFGAIHAALDLRGADGGSFTLVAGTVDRLRVMTGGPGQGGMPMGFHGPHMLAGPLAAVAGAAGSGRDEAGDRFTHAHAAFRDRHGRLVGGHLIAGETIAGGDGITVDLVAIHGGRFARRIDPETHFTLFHPERA